MPHITHYYRGLSDSSLRAWPTNTQEVVYNQKRHAILGCCSHHIYQLQLSLRVYANLVADSRYPTWVPLSLNFLLLRLVFWTTEFGSKFIWLSTLTTLKLIRFLFLKNYMVISYRVIGNHNFKNSRDSNLIMFAFYLNSQELCH